MKKVDFLYYIHGSFKDFHHKKDNRKIYLCCGPNLSPASVDWYLNKIESMIQDGNTVEFIDLKRKFKNVLLWKHNKHNDEPIFIKNDLKFLMEQDYDNVIVFGQSLGYCDYSRFQFMRKKLHNCKWYISFHYDTFDSFLKSESFELITNFIKMMGISSENVFFYKA